MKIAFIGQKGIPAKNEKKWNGKNAGISREKRVEILSGNLATAGHEVIVSSSPSYSTKSIRRFNGVSILNKMSFKSKESSGVLHDVLVASAVLRRKFDLIHIHGWRMAGVMSALVLHLRPKLIWTIDSMPRKKNWFTRYVLREMVRFNAEITVPNRQLQYHMLNTYGVKVAYIPDGYAVFKIPNIPISRLGLRRGKYILTTATDTRSLRWIAKAYKAAGVRRKLVVLADLKGTSYRRLKKEFSFLAFVGPKYGRQLDSLIDQASIVFFAGENDNIESALLAMDKRKAIVATVQPLLEEYLGVTAQFVASMDEDGLSNILKPLAKDEKLQQKWGAKARARARRHFTWERIIPEYRVQYALQRRMLPMDSALSTRYGKLPTAVVS